MKNLGKAKTIIKQEIIRDMKVKTLKIDQKRYIQDLLEAEKITLCHTTILLIKFRFFICID